MDGITPWWPANWKLVHVRRIHHVRGGGECLPFLCDDDSMAMPVVPYVARFDSCVQSVLAIMM